MQAPRVETKQGLPLGPLGPLARGQEDPPSAPWLRASFQAVSTSGTFYLSDTQAGLPKSVPDFKTKRKAAENVQTQAGRQFWRRSTEHDDSLKQQKLKK